MATARPTRPRRPASPLNNDRHAMACYLRDCQAYCWSIEKQKNFTARFYKENTLPEFFSAIDTSTKRNNKILNKSARDNLAWEDLKLVPMMFCVYPGCNAKYTFTERGEHICERHVIAAHFPQFTHLIAAESNFTPKKLLYDVSMPHVDFALIGDFANSKDEWKRIQAGKVLGARPTCSASCPSGWVERNVVAPLPMEAQEYLDSLSPQASSSIVTTPVVSEMSTPIECAGPALHKLDKDDKDADTRSLFSDDASGSPFLDDTSAPVTPPTSIADVYDFDPVAYPPLDCPIGKVILKGSTGELINEDTGEPLPCHQVFGYPAYIIDPPRPYESLEDLFTPRRPLVEAEPWWLPPLTQQDQVSRQEPDTHVDIYRYDNLPVQPYLPMAY